MNFPKHFISAGTEYADFEHQVPAPYLRKSFVLDAAPKSAELVVTGLGFYRVFLNGTELTKSVLAPYISNPDDMIYYDRYEVAGHLHNGMQNCFGGFVWDFEKAAWRSAPMTALELCVQLTDGAEVRIESDETFRVHPSGLLENDLRSGEIYDARLEIDGWCEPGLDDGSWQNAVTVKPPRGEARLCTASVIRTLEKRQAVSITPCMDGYLYDFGIDAAGACELCIRGERGQQVSLSYVECCKDGKPDKENITFPDFDSSYVNRVQDMTYICRGDRQETYLPHFSYYGFRYVYVTGITKEQATKELLTYHVMGGDFKEVANFSCSDEIANQLQEMTRRSVFSNFLWIPTDCPHREKNGWTGDAALSAEHMLLNLSVEDSLREWYRNVEKAQNEAGCFPGIVPTGGWGYTCGPAWDQVIAEIPYQLYHMRSDLETAKEAAPHIFRYLFYLSGIRNAKGLLEEGLGDWCETGKSGGGQKSPVEVTSTAIAVHLLEEAKTLFAALHKTTEYTYADTLQKELRAAFRKHLIDFRTMTVAGNCQTSQAMAIHYGLFEPGESQAAFAHLLFLIHQNKDHMDGGALGLRILFQVLADYGEADLAYKMITRTDYPSYGHWIARGATALWEDFLPEGDKIHSQNHHFFGDISRWFIENVTGIVPNPDLAGTDTVRIAPNFIETLEHAEASYDSPCGKISVRWEKTDAATSLEVEIPEGVTGEIRLPKDWMFADGFREKTLEAGKTVYKAVRI